MFRLIPSTLLCLVASSASAAPLPPPTVPPPTFLGNDFQDAWNAPPGTLYLTAMYDGVGSAETAVEMSCGGTRSWLRTGLMMATLTHIYTFAWEVGACEPTGRIAVRGVVPNGYADGIGLGVFWKDLGDTEHVIKSNAAHAQYNVVGVHHLRNFSDQALIEGYASDLTDGLDILRVLVPGSVLLLDGVYRYDLF